MQIINPGVYCSSTSSRNDSLLLRRFSIIIQGRTNSTVFAPSTGKKVYQYAREEKVGIQRQKMVEFEEPCPPVQKPYAENHIDNRYKQYQRIIR